MPSRNISDCSEKLQLVWETCKKVYLEKYPDEPQPFLTCTFRTNDEQRALYAQGRTAKGKIVTYIEEGGKHNVYPARAFDIAFKTKGNKLDWSALHFKRFAKIVDELFDGVKWGGDWTRFKDLPHFEE
jgi:peptidoglycan L-alanyl-D-glutamate endopeptidase CwlK